MVQRKSDGSAECFGANPMARPGAGRRRFRPGEGTAARAFKKMEPEPSISRILFPRIAGTAVIHLAPGSLPGSSGLPKSVGRAALIPCGKAFLFDLAPCGVCRAAAVASDAVRSYRTISPLPRRRRGGIFSVALSVGSPLPRVTRHTALWSSDFPRPLVRGRDCPDDSGSYHSTASRAVRQICTGCRAPGSRADPPVPGRARFFLAPETPSSIQMPPALRFRRAPV